MSGANRASGMKQATRRYVIEFGGAMLVYAVALVVALLLVQANPTASWRYGVVVAPVIPVCFGLVAIIRYVGRMDELQRRIQFGAVIFSFGATAIITFTYGFLELVGFPTLSYLWVLPLMVMLWGVGSAVATRRYA